MAVILVKHMLFAVMISSGPMGAVPFPTADTKEKNRRSNCSTEASFLVLSSMNGNCTDDRVGRHHHGRQKEVTSRDLARIRTSWRQTFEEIKSLVVPTSAKQDSLESHDIFSRWKAFLDEKSGFDVVPPSDRISGAISEISQESKTAGKGARVSLQKTRLRYDGFLSWEKLLQQWADDVSDYVSEPNHGGKEASARASIPNIISGDSITDGEENDDDVGVLQNYYGDEVTFPNRSYTNEEKILQGKDNNKGSLLSLGPSLLPFAPRPVEAGDDIVAKTDLSDKSKNIWIVTTAALPWMTGTAVNPLLRAAYMCAGRAEVGGSVTILLPWLERDADQTRVYGKGKAFKSRGEQEKHVRSWLCDTAGMEDASTELRIRWYTAWQERAENSIYSMGDITSLIPEDEADICILEEPEHLNWYRAPGEGWTEKFKHVVGIVHTNYFVYAQEQPAALIRAPAMRLLCSWMCRAHCHRVIKLSGTLQVLAPEKELVENVHGVRSTFLSIGEELRGKLLAESDLGVFGPEAPPSVYFIGKLLWSKGIGSLMELVKYAEESAGLVVDVDMYGYGPDAEEAEAKSQKLGLGMRFHGPIDHAALANSHKIFINPSTSEVLCTTVAEALAMGKFVIVPSHPSNDFFAQFPNCLPYTSKEEFVAMLYYALTHSPEPLSDKYLRALSWEAATERFEAAGSISVAEADALSSILSAPEAGVEISLPPLIEDESRRKRVTKTLKKTRLRFRQFRSRLSQEIQDSNVLPKDLQHRVVNELDKKLDLDLDKVLASPKLRLKLSAAELDKQLLELYNKVSQSPSGDVLRVVGGGTDVGKQNLYVKQQARKGKRRNSTKNVFEAREIYQEEDGAAGLVRLTLAQQKGRSSGRKGGIDMHLCMFNRPSPGFRGSSHFARPLGARLK